MAAPDLRRPDQVAIACLRANGGVSVTWLVEREYAPDPNDPSKRIPLEKRDTSDEFINALIAEQNLGRPPEWQFVSWRRVPNDWSTDDDDRTYRMAWEDDGSPRHVVNLDKAKVIHRDRLRDAGAPQRVINDQRITNAQTVEELKALTLEVLL